MSPARLQLIARTGHPDFLDLPWDEPLAEWTSDRLVEVVRGNKALNGALSAITAAVVGVILNLAIWFAVHTIFRETTPVRIARISLRQYCSFALATAVS